MNSQTLDLDIAPSLELDVVARHLGGRRKRDLSNSTRVKIEKNSRILEDLTETHLFYREREIERKGPGWVGIKDGPVFRSRKLALALGKSKRLIVFVITIGPRVDEQIRNYMDEGFGSKGFILDALGSAAVENMVERFHKDSDRKLREEGKAATLRFSPGYCDWPVTEQKKLFSLLPAGELKVSLTESCLMIPRKTVSGVFGIVDLKDILGERPYNPCLDCGNDRCSARRSQLHA